MDNVTETAGDRVRAYEEAVRNGYIRSYEDWKAEREPMSMSGICDKCGNDRSQPCAALERAKDRHSSLTIQVAGDHYKNKAIQPVEYIHANNLGFIEGCVVKYVSRWKDKGGLADLEKARHFIDMLIELETKTNGAED